MTKQISALILVAVLSPIASAQGGLRAGVQQAHRMLASENDLVFVVNSLSKLSQWQYIDHDITNSGDWGSDPHVDWEPDQWIKTEIYANRHGSQGVCDWASAREAANLNTDGYDGFEGAYCNFSVEMEYTLVSGSGKTYSFTGNNKLVLTQFYADFNEWSVGGNSCQYYDTGNGNGYLECVSAEGNTAKFTKGGGHYTFNLDIL